MIEPLKIYEKHTVSEKSWNPKSWEMRCTEESVFILCLLSKTPGVASLGRTSHNKLSGESSDTSTSGSYWKYHNASLLCNISVIVMPIQELKKRKLLQKF